MKNAAMLLALLVSLSAGTAWAQPGPGGNFDPAEMRQRMMERYRDMLEVKSDDEWKLIQIRVEKVMQTRRDAMAGSMRMMGGPGGPGGGSDNGPGGPPPDQAGGQSGGPGGPGFGAASLPELEALQKAIANKASNEELKSKLAALRTARKAKQAKYEAAQEDLKKLLSARQEAAAVVAGLLQ